MRASHSFFGAVASVAALSLTGASAWAQSSVATDPVGFVTETVKGGGTVATPQLSLISPTLMQPVDWQGTVGTITGTAITVSGNPWTAGQFGTNGQYFVEVVSGTTPGAWTDIEASTTGGLTTLDDLSSFASQGSTIRIRKHVTLAGFFGATNTAGLKTGVSLANADHVIVYDGASPKVYWYYDATDNNGEGAGWVNTSFQPAADVVIAPGAGVVIERRDSAPLTFLSLGAVNMGNTFVPVDPGLNVVGTVAAKGLTLATSGLYTGNSTTGVKGSISLNGADEVNIYTPTSQKVYFYYDASDNNGVGAGWVDTSFNPSDSVSIAPGSALVIRRKSPGVAFNWSLPSPTSF